ncbi:MAG: metalloregulator ArsR/SmtB family transcription factor [Thermoleophilia bacterium]
MDTPMPLPHPLPNDLAGLIAERFRLLAEPMRLRLLDQLRDGPLTVGALTERLGATQQNVSKHLGVLHAGGILAREKQGTSVSYRIADEGVFALCEHMCGAINGRISAVRDMLHTNGPEARS